MIGRRGVGGREIEGKEERRVGERWEEEGRKRGDKEERR